MYMKTRILKLVIVLVCALCGTNVFAQLFSTNKVLVYVKAGQEPSQASDVIVIAYYEYDDKIQNMSSSARKVRETIASHPSYFESPYNIPSTSNTLSSSYRPPKWCEYNSSASTSKYRVYSGVHPAGSNAWGSWKSSTTHWAFSKDAKQMIVWFDGREDERKTYLLTELSEFDPSTSTSSNYDFLE